MRTITHEIKREECVGDSISKHNFNFLILDTFICNISSSFFNTTENFKKYFDMFNTKIPSYEKAYKDFNSKQMFRYDLVYSTVDLVSSFWCKNEFSIVLNFNISKDYNPVIENSYLKPKVAKEFETQREYIQKFLTLNFPSSSFYHNAIANVIVFYNTVINDDTIELLRYTIDGEWQENNNNEQIQLMTVNMSKIDVSLSGMNVFKFENSNKSIGWNLYDLYPSLTEQKLRVKIGPIYDKRGNGINSMD